LKTFFSSIIKVFFAVFLLSSGFSLSAQEKNVLDETPSYKEISYYLNKLYSTQREEERIQYNKIIHDAVVNADLSSKKVVKEMTPIIEKISKAVADNLDRTNISGREGWLTSAINFFKNEKLVPGVSVPSENWFGPQEEGRDGTQITVFPDRVMVMKGGETQTIVRGNNIHEAVISPDGRKVAFFQVEKESGPAEIWIFDIKREKKKKIAVVESCFTLLFSNDGGRVFFQALKKDGETESDISVISANGGKPRFLLKGSILDTLVASGSYRGYLIVYRRGISHLGTPGAECAYLFNSNGKLVGRIKGPVCR